MPSPTTSPAASSDSPASHSRSAGPSSLGWWVRDRHGRLAVALWPNPAIVVWAVFRLLSLPGSALGVGSATWSTLASGALAVWAADELARGDSPVRRVLGAAVLALVLVGVLT